MKIRRRDEQTEGSGFVRVKREQENNKDLGKKRRGRGGRVGAEERSQGYGTG